MGSPVFWARFAIATLAVWRLAHLLSVEDGPGRVVARLRARLGSSLAGQAMDCFGCMSLWLAAPAALFVGGGALDLVAIWLALSGVAFLLERMAPGGLEIGPLPAEPVKHDFEPWMEIDDGLLQSLPRSWPRPVTDAGFGAVADGHAGREPLEPAVRRTRGGRG